MGSLHENVIIISSKLFIIFQLLKLGGIKYMGSLHENVIIINKKNLFFSKNDFEYYNSLSISYKL
jgi:hypothetical protein